MLKVVVFGLNFGGVQRPKKVGFGMTLGLLRPQNLHTVCFIYNESSATDNLDINSTG